MDFSEEWKSQFPIGKVFTPPLLLSSQSSKSTVGPLFFNPNPETRTQLFSSPSIAPPLLTPPPQLSLSRFLSISSHGSNVPLSVSSSIASQFGPQNFKEDASFVFSHNRLQFLQCPNNNGVVVFFSTGCNHDQIGFLLLSVKNSNLVAQGDEKGEIFKAKNSLHHRIIRISVNPVASCYGVSGKSTTTVGYLLACTMYSVHWYCVKFNKVSERPVLSELGSKVFKSCSIVASCWSPHLPEENIVLLESGALFLFDLDACLETQKSNACIKGSRLRVSWDDAGITQNCKWLSCEFSWHPRVLIVACSDAVFLCDLRCDECKLSCIAKVEMLHLYAPVMQERFTAFSTAGPDGFHYVVVSNSLLVLCDVRKPFMPVLQWDHGLDRPCYIDVLRLSQLRARPRDHTYEWASESGFCIIVGSFWNCEFGLFCYGPSLPAQPGSVTADISKFCQSLYAWELPSEFSLIGRACQCGSCLLREEFSKEALREWADWQEKKEMVLGFGILDEDLFMHFAELDEFGGFTVIRLMSSGRLELQRYFASWGLSKNPKLTHRHSLFQFESNLLDSRCDEKYKFPKRFKYFKLDYLVGYLNGYLSEILDSKLKEPHKGPPENDSFSLEFHEILCEKVKVCGFSRFRTSPAIFVVFDDISLPTSLHEVALRRIWAGLPLELLQLAFSSYSELLEVCVDEKKVSLEFLAVQDLPQLPPFILRDPPRRSSKWSCKVQCSDDLVGPVLPFPVLHTLHEFRNGCKYSKEVRFSSDVEFSILCDEVVQVAKEMSVSDSCSEVQDDHTVSLADDSEKIWAEADSQKRKPFFLYNPIAVGFSTVGYKDERFSAFISKLSENEPLPNDKADVGLELLDNLNPITLKFDVPVTGFGSGELKSYRILVRQCTRWQEGVVPFKDFCSQTKFQRLDA